MRKEQEFQFGEQKNRRPPPEEAIDELIRWGCSRSSWGWPGNRHWPNKRRKRSDDAVLAGGEGREEQFAKRTLLIELHCEEKKWMINGR